MRCYFEAERILKTACFKILTEQMRLYVQKFDGEFLATKYFSKSDKKAEINCYYEKYKSI